VPEDQQFQVLSPLQTFDDVNPCNPGRVSITKAVLD